MKRSRRFWPAWRRSATSSTPSNMYLGEGGAPSRALIEEALRPLTEMRAVCFKALGRKP